MDFISVVGMEKEGVKKSKIYWFIIYKRLMVLLGFGKFRSRVEWSVFVGFILMKRGWVSRLINFFFLWGKNCYLL